MSLRLDDYDPTLDAQADGDLRLVDHAGEQAMPEDDDSLDGLAGLQASCIECGQPFAPLNDTGKLCARCYVEVKS